VTETCRVCDRPATRQLGAYAFCEVHYERATRQRGSVLVADVFSAVLLVAFVLILFAVDRLVQPDLSGDLLVMVGVIIALVPAAIWLWFFYRRDRLEPEPKGYVLGVFLLGALLAAGVGIPLVDRFFRVGEWLNASFVTQVFGGILIVGFVQEFLKYAAVRFSVYESQEFDEWTDGILYGTAAGLGYATMLNIDFIVGSGGANLGPAAVTVALTALVHASLGGIVGYFLGRDKLEVRPVWWQAAGLAIAAVLNGLYFYVRAVLTSGFVGPIPTNLLGLLLALGLAVLITWFLSRSLQRGLAATLRGGTTPAAPAAPVGE
jgi:RsiW-degrading membrane proteinase PrsW (M82 family)